MARYLFAFRHPRLAVRRLSGHSVIEISVGEIASQISPPSVIVEAGGLDGEDTKRLANCWPDAEVHVFEPVPAAFDLVKQNTEHLRNVHRYQLALSDNTGTSAMYISSAADGTARPDSSSLLAPTGHLREMPTVKFDERIVVETITLSDWMRQNRVSEIGLLWLDLQGMELSVLQASASALVHIQAVALEISRRELYAGTPLYPEVVSWMRSQGFEVAIDRVSYLFGNALFLRR